MNKKVKALLVLTATSCLLITGCNNNPSTSSQSTTSQQEIVDPVISASTVNYTKGSGKDLVVAINLYGQSIVGIYRGQSTLTEGKDYTYTNYKLTLKTAFLEKLSVGANVKLEIETNKGGFAEFKVSIKGEEKEVVDPELVSTTFDYDQTKDYELKVNVDYKGYSLDSLTKGNQKLIPGTDFRYSSTYIVLTKTYLDSLALGENELTITSTSDGYTNFKLNVSKSDPQPGPEPVKADPVFGSTLYTYTKKSSTGLTLLVDYKGGEVTDLYQGTKEEGTKLLLGTNYFVGKTSIVLPDTFLSSLPESSQVFTLVTDIGKSSTTVSVKNEGSTPAVSEPPAVSSLSYDFGKGSESDLRVVVDFRSQPLESLREGQNTLSLGTDYTKSDTDILFKATYLNSLALGAHTYTLKTNGGEVSFAINVSDLIKPVSPAQAPTIVNPTASYILGSSTDITFATDYKGEGVSSVSLYKGSALQKELALKEEFSITESAITLKKEFLESFKDTSETVYKIKIETVGGVAEIALTIKPENTTGKLTRYTPSKVYKYVYSPLGDDVMPIQAYIAPTITDGRNHNNLAAYQIAKESGINTVQALYESAGPTYTKFKQEIFNALDYCQEVGMAYMVRNYNIGQLAIDGTYQDEVAKYYNYKSFCGFLYFDEPNAKDFDLIAAGQAAARKLFPQYALYLNLFPIYADPGAWGTSTYNEYLDTYISKVKPDYLAYDFYAQEGTFPNVKSQHFTQLEIAEEKASNAGIPFWPFLLSTGHMTYRLPTEADIYWQASTSLAFGAKGLQYFTYEIPNDNDGFASATGGFVNRDGTKSSIFNYLKKCNNHVNRMARVLVNSTVIKKFSIGSHPCPLNTSSTVEGGYGNVNSGFRELSSITNSNGSMIVTMFDYNGKTAVYVCNTGLQSNASCRLNFSKTVDANVFTLDGESSQTSKTSIDISLVPGASALVELTNYQREVK